MQLELHRAAAEAGSDHFTVHTDVFDGPLDLLLYLVKRDGIDLAHLEVRQIADAYLQFLDRLRSLDLSLAADWLVMAATLVHLKSLELLPRPPALLEEEEVDPREQLVEQLREYERLKAEATALDGLDRVGREVFVRSAQEVDGPGRPVASPIDAFGLLDLFFDLLKRSEAPEPVVSLAEGGPDVGSCCRRVLAALGGKGGVGELGAMLRSLHTAAERVVTFVGVLEMTRLGWLDVEQPAHLAPVRVEQLVEDDEIDLEVVLGFIEEDDEPPPPSGPQMDLPL